jgi:hypothetical protein
MGSGAVGGRGKNHAPDAANYVYRFVDDEVADTPLIIWYLNSRAGGGDVNSELQIHTPDYLTGGHHYGEIVTPMGWRWVMGFVKGWLMG